MSPAWGERLLQFIFATAWRLILVSIRYALAASLLPKRALVSIWRHSMANRTCSHRRVTDRPTLWSPTQASSCSQLLLANRRSRSVMDTFRMMLLEQVRTSPKRSTMRTTNVCDTCLSAHTLLRHGVTRSRSLEMWTTSEPQPSECRRRVPFPWRTPLVTPCAWTDGPTTNQVGHIHGGQKQVLGWVPT